MSRYETVDRVTEIHKGKFTTLFDSGYDVCQRTEHATEVVFGGLLDGAVKEAERQRHDPKIAAHEAWRRVMSGLGGKAIGLGCRLHPLLGAGAVGMSLYSFGKETAPMLSRTIPELQKYWDKAYDESDPTMLSFYKSKVGSEFGHAALELGINGSLAVIGFGGGLKTGDYVKPRLKSLMRSCENLRETSGINTMKAVYLDKILQQRKFGAKLKVAESGKYVFYPDKSYEAHYADGSVFHMSKRGIGSTVKPDGSKTTEIPGVMRIERRQNGDQIFKYHQDGLVETHKKNGNVVRELSDGVRETRKPNGDVFREVPFQPIELIRKKQS
jgi:hypothetical protein